MSFLCTELRALITQPGPAALGPESRPGTLAQDDLNRTLDELFRRHGPPAQAQLIRALLLFWHDHLDASHTISQSIENPDGSLVHGIMHRREPDYSNAKYWFRQVGQHPCYKDLAKRVQPLLAADAKLAAQLLPRGIWDALAFVDAVEAAVSQPATEARHRLLRAVQQAETEAVLEYAGISSFPSLNEEPDIMWFGIRSVFFWGTRSDGISVFEERICVFSGKSSDEAFAKAEKESDTYAEFIGAICHSWQEAFYQDGDALIDGYEVWSQLFEFSGDLEAFFQSRYAKYDYQGDKALLPFRKAREPKAS